MSTPTPSFLSPFVGFDTVTKTLSTGHTIDLKVDIPAGDAYALFRLMRKLSASNDPEDMKAIVLLFLDAWSFVAAPDGEVIPITGDALDNLKFTFRSEIDAIVEAHVAAWVSTTTGILGDAAQSPEGSDPLGETPTHGGAPSSASRKASTKRRTT